jgi:hypothetical protein
MRYAAEPVPSEMERDGCKQCPHCELSQVVKNGRDRRGAQVYRCADCHRSYRHSVLGSFLPTSGDRFGGALVSALSTELCRGGRVARRAIYFCRHLHRLRLGAEVFSSLSGRRESLPSPGGSALVGGRNVWESGRALGYVYRAIDEQGQVVEVLFREHRDTEAATAFFRTARKSTGVTPHTVTTDKAAAYPPALAQILPEVEHITGKAEQQRLERDHQHLKGRLKVFRGCKTRDSAQRFCQAHGFVRNLRQGFYQLGTVPRNIKDAIRPQLVRAWEELTLQLLAA